MSGRGSDVAAPLWCEHAWLGGDGVEAGVLIELGGESIAAVSAAASAPSGATMLRGLTLPGFANAHSHAFQRAIRARTQTARGSFWSWREAMYDAAARLDPDNYLALARAAFAEMALAGITTVGEFHYVHHRPDGSAYEDPNALGLAVIEAARQAGVRITLIDACYLRAGVGEPEPTAAQRRFCDPSADAWAERTAALADGPRARIGAAIHSIRAVDPEAAAVVAAAADAASRPLHAHVSEQPAENEACLNAYGRSPTQVLAEAGALTASFTGVHATHVSADDARLFGEAGACCCICPTTERDLGDGIGRPSRLLSAGARLAFGSDSNAIIDPFEEARACELDERLASGERVHQTPAELVGAATGGGQRSLGWPEAGSIAPGQLADLVTLDLQSPRLAGVGADQLLAAAVFCAQPADVSQVMVAGRPIVVDGAHVELDVVAELERSIRALDSASGLL